MNEKVKWNNMWTYYYLVRARMDLRMIDKGRAFSYRRQILTYLGSQRQQS